ncbi:hypothetical protein KAU33_11980 [Candidatus Dependentiae bacterium]|nr:hypothetical protein [Candidatus Dependentiae bacterium]
MKLEKVDQPSITSKDSDERLKSKNISFIFELPSVNYLISETGRIVPSSFREGILKRNIYFINFIDELEILNFMVYLPPVHIEMLDDFLNGNVDKVFAISTKKFNDLNEDEKKLVLELPQGSDSNSDVLSPAQLNEEWFLNIICRYNLSLLKDFEIEDDEDWEKVKVKTSGFTNEDKELLLTLEVRALSEYRNKLKKLLKSYSIEFLSNTRSGSEPGLFLSEAAILTDTSSLSILTDLKDGRNKYFKSSGYFSLNRDITQKEIPLITTAGFSYILTDEEALMESLQSIEYPGLSLKEIEQFPYYIFFTVETGKIIQILFYHSEFKDVFKQENLKDYKQNLRKIYDSIPDNTAEGVFENKDPLYIVLIPTDVLFDYTKEDFKVLKELFEYTIDLYMFSYVPIKNHLKKHNDKEKMFLLRDLLANAHRDIYRDWNKAQKMSFDILTSMKKDIKIISTDLEKIEDPEKLMTATGELDKIKRDFLTLRSYYSNLNEFTVEEFDLFSSQMKKIIKEFDIEEFTKEHPE